MKKIVENQLTQFFEFVREQGVIGLAIGFMLGGAATKLVSALVQDIINPLVGIALGAADELNNSYFEIGSAKILWGHFTNTIIDFLIISMVVYVGVKVLGLDRLDKKKEAAKKK
jgi:large conductance mechanosensitive channel